MILDPGEPTSWIAYVEVPDRLTAEIDLQIVAESSAS